jgi:hypothetical protein
MDPCVPGVSLSDARAFARNRLGVPPQYAKKMSVVQICKAVKGCSKSNIMPPMSYKTFKNKTYLIDPDSPLTIKEFIILFKKGTAEEIKKIAKKLKFITEYISLKEVKSNIVKFLQVSKILEPIELPSKRTKNLGNNGGGGGLGNNRGNGALGNNGGIGNGALGNNGGNGGNNGALGNNGTLGNGGNGGNNGTLGNGGNGGNNGALGNNGGNNGALGNNGGNGGGGGGVTFKKAVRQKINFSGGSGGGGVWNGNEEGFKIKNNYNGNVNSQLRNIKLKSDKASKMLNQVKRNVVGNNRRNHIRNTINSSIFNSSSSFNSNSSF